MSKKTYTVNLSEELVKEIDQEIKIIDFSRSQLIEYLLKKWKKEGCKIIIGG